MSGDPAREPMPTKEERAGLPLGIDPIYETADPKANEPGIPFDESVLPSGPVRYLAVGEDLVTCIPHNYVPGQWASGKAVMSYGRPSEMIQKAVDAELARRATLAVRSPVTRQRLVKIGADHKITRQGWIEFDRVTDRFQRIVWDDEEAGGLPP